ncbi:hypothetical protein GX51_07060 [Blastomyces parvus]|uniref:Profilin n=1 Tax=Blastomyces parvus TaxID=2060905 RepID=A0A2B7WN86_9EURO|nr:hypothetical protein GX51_07060 [Blastomyces parvus]
MAEEHDALPTTWQDFHDRLKRYEGIDKAAIYSIETMSPCATTPGFTALPDEIAFLIKALVDASRDRLDELQTKGFSFAGEKYFFVRADSDPECIIGRKVVHTPPPVPFLFELGLSRAS